MTDPPPAESQIAVIGAQLRAALKHCAFVAWPRSAVDGKKPVPRGEHRQRLFLELAQQCTRLFTQWRPLVKARADVLGAPSAQAGPPPPASASDRRYTTASPAAPGAPTSSLVGALVCVKRGLTAVVGAFASDSHAVILGDRATLQACASLDAKVEQAVASVAFIINLCHPQRRPSAPARAHVSPRAATSSPRRASPRAAEASPRAAASASPSPRRASPTSSPSTSSHNGDSSPHVSPRIGSLRNASPRDVPSGDGSPRSAAESCGGSPTRARSIGPPGAIPLPMYRRRNSSRPTSSAYSSHERHQAEEEASHAAETEWHSFVGSLHQAPSPTDRLIERRSTMAAGTSRESMEAIPRPMRPAPRLKVQTPSLSQQCGFIMQCLDQMRAQLEGDADEVNITKLSDLLHEAHPHMRALLMDQSVDVLERNRIRGLMLDCVKKFRLLIKQDQLDVATLCREATASALVFEEALWWLQRMASSESRVRRSSTFSHKRMSKPRSLLLLEEEGRGEGRGSKGSQTIATASRESPATSSGADDADADGDEQREVVTPDSDGNDEDLDASPRYAREVHTMLQQWHDRTTALCTRAVRSVQPGWSPPQEAADVASTTPSTTFRAAMTQLPDGTAVTHALMEEYDACFDQYVGLRQMGDFRGIPEVPYETAMSLLRSLMHVVSHACVAIFDAVGRATKEADSEGGGEGGGCGEGEDDPTQCPAVQRFSAMCDVVRLEFARLKGFLLEVTGYQSSLEPGPSGESMSATMVTSYITEVMTVCDDAIANVTQRFNAHIRNIEALPQMAALDVYNSFFGKAILGRMARKWLNQVKPWARDCIQVQTECLVQRELFAKSRAELMDMLYASKARMLTGFRSIVEGHIPEPLFRLNELILQVEARLRLEQDKWGIDPNAPAVIRRKMSKKERRALRKSSAKKAAMAPSVRSPAISMGTVRGARFDNEDVHDLSRRALDASLRPI